MSDDPPDIVTDNETELDIYQKGKQLIEEQAMIGEDHQNLDLLELETRRAKTENFKASLRGIMEVSHELELLSAKSEQFKRKDELALLNSLRLSCTKHAKALENVGNLIMDRIETMMVDPTTIDMKELDALQEAAIRNLKQLESVVAQSEQIIRIERMSGGRPYGHRPGDYKNPHQYAQYLFSLMSPQEILDGNEGSSVKSKRVKVLSEAEVRELKRRA